MKDRNRQDSPYFRRRSTQRPERSRERRNDHGRQWYREQRRPLPQKINQERPISQLAPRINRKQTCPFLVRVFYAINNENSFADAQKFPQNQIKLHLWMSSSLREVAELMRCYLPGIRTKQSFIFYRVHQVEGRPGLSKTALGMVMMHRKNERVEERYLGNWHFSIGDHLDVSMNYK